MPIFYYYDLYKCPDVTYDFTCVFLYVSYMFTVILSLLIDSRQLACLLGLGALGKAYGDVPWLATDLQLPTYSVVNIDI